MMMTSMMTPMGLLDPITKVLFENVALQFVDGRTGDGVCCRKAVLDIFALTIANAACLPTRAPDNLDCLSS